MDERRRASRKQEKRTAKRLGARLHAGSGSGPWRSNDSSTSHNAEHQFLIENKTVLHGRRQITIKADDLEPLVVRARLEDRLPLLEAEVGGRAYYITPVEDFEDYVEQMGGSG